MSIPNDFLSLLKDVPVRSIWQLKIGGRLINEIQEKQFQLIENENSQTLIIEQQWQLYSGANDIFPQENIARQHFFSMAQQQQKLQNYLSENRCLILVELDETWRLWQIIKFEQSLFNLLTSAIAQGSNKKTAALLLVSMEKFLLASQQFDELEFYPDLTLDNLTLHNNKPIFLGFMPTHEQKSEHDLKRAFSCIFAEILMLPKSDIKEILHYLELYAQSHKDNKILLNSLQALLAV